MQTRPTIEYLHECFSLLDGGGLIWKIRPEDHFCRHATAVSVNKQRAGKPAGIVGKDGYLLVRVAGLLIPAHLIVFALTAGRWPENEIDHQDRDRSNNKPDNLREATRPQNMANMAAHRDSKTGARGVTEHKPGVYRARIRHAGRIVDLGLFRDIDAASRAYRTAEIELRGEFAS
jgi:hypothetical protein